MRILLLSTMAAAVATSAFAADLPSRRAQPYFAPPPPLPVFTWTGVYLGVHAGYEFGGNNGFIFNNVNGVPVAAGGTSRGTVIGGAHVGYNYALAGYGGWGIPVVGIEGDVDGSNDHAAYAIGAVTDSYSQRISGSARGRLGLGVDRALFYVTGGAAFAGLHNTYTSTLGTDVHDRTRIGWTAGAGAEYAFTENWSARVEYRYTDFGSFNDVLLASTAGGIGTARHHDTDQRVTAGISYKFGGFGVAPVVARY